MRSTELSTIKEVLARQVVEILPSRAGLEALMQKKKIRLYLGVDPTSPHLHLGHAIVLRKLRQFQELGHKAFLLFGTFTALIGDPSGRDQERKPLSPKEVQKNIATYQGQAEKILDFSRVRVVHNGDWLGKLILGDFLKLCSHVTVSQLLGRDMFQRRIEKGGEVWAHEFLYPLLQGYDSVALNVDLEIGATDQTFNMLIGRRLQKIYHNKEKFVLSTPLLLGLDGRKMSKTHGNAVNLLDPPQEMYGKLMSLRDELIGHYFELCTEVPTLEVNGIKERLAKGSVSARDAKATLAKEIVTLYHGARKAEKAACEFDRVFQERLSPSRVPKVVIPEKKMFLGDFLVKTGLAHSKGEARRLVGQKGVRIDGEVQQDWRRVVEVKKGMVVQVGKRRFVEIKT